MPPHPDSTDHFIFDTVSSLLQRWPNTLYRNGHTVVPVTMPIGTVLYHGRITNDVPTVPDWTSVEFDHAYIYCRDGPCYIVSLMATRDLRLAHFDGTSAAKMGTGTLDSQDVLTWGKPFPDRCMDEWQRIEDLCAWGKPFGIEGFLRTGFQSEVMLCDFSAGLQVISLLNYIPKHGRDPAYRLLPLGDPDKDECLPLPPVHYPQPNPPEGWKGSLPESAMADFQGLVTGSWYNRDPGETRFHIEYSALVTFYDTALTSLVAARRGVRRDFHRLTSISVNDTTQVRAELAEAFGRRARGSGVDWGSITRVIVERYAERLETLRYILEPEPSNATQQAALVRVQLLTMLVPYMTTDSVPTNPSWTSSLVQRCSTPPTSLLPAGLLTPQERRIRDAVQGTLREICRRLTLMWVDAFDIEEASEDRARAVLGTWKKHVGELMDWLGWSVWVRCIPGCNPDAICYVPSWPAFVEGDSPYDMTPRCISLLRPGKLA
ncbi:hypothetical protein BV25DRAFT_1807890 [Artomyces pyxidatus]|uniref:Uncharacterized protein n=1 Tax=Artomyces pyxidatus TaxID=48021 RepID=A0ACB8SW59_9AGAM|nr:hypothetical protein BV25DRAFT_1807890 [Artomyces pyxidatus]